jgi:hypothetical protein
MGARTHRTGSRRARPATRTDGAQRPSPSGDTRDSLAERTRAWATVALKLAAGLLAWRSCAPGAGAWTAGCFLGANALASGILLTWGVANVCAGALVLCGVIGSADGLN